MDVTPKVPLPGVFSLTVSPPSVSSHSKFTNELTLSTGNPMHMHE